MSTLKGIGKFLGKLVERNLRPIDDEFDSELQTMLEEKSQKIKISREDNIRFANITGDTNPIHRDLEAALAFNFGGMKFTDTPIIGTYLAMIGEQFSYRIFRSLRDHWGEDGQDLKIIGQETKFKDPVYPDDDINWQVSGYNERSEYVDISLTGKVGKKVVVEVATKLGYLFGRMPPIAAPIIQPSKDKIMTIGPEEVRALNEMTNGGPTDRIPLTLLPALATRTMLAYKKQKTGDMVGLNRLMNFTFFDLPQTGEIQVDIYRPKRIANTTRSDFHRYILRAVCGLTTDSKPLCYGEIKIMCPQELDFSPTV